MCGYEARGPMTRDSGMGGGDMLRDSVRGTVARAREEVGPTRGITVKAAPTAAAAAVMPGVRRTPGRPRGGDTRGRNDPPPSPGSHMGGGGEFRQKFTYR